MRSGRDRFHVTAAREKWRGQAGSNLASDGLNLDPAAAAAPVSSYPGVCSESAKSADERQIAGGREGRIGGRHNPTGLGQILGEEGWGGTVFLPDPRPVGYKWKVCERTRIGATMDPSLYEKASGKFYDWTQEIGGKYFSAIINAPLDEITLAAVGREIVVLLGGAEAVEVRNIGNGSFGQILKFTYERKSDRFPTKMDLVDIVVKVIDLNNPDFKNNVGVKRAIINGLKTARELAACDLVRFKAWITRLNLPETEPGPEPGPEPEPEPEPATSLEITLDDRSTEDILRDVTDQSLVIIAMQPAEGDGQNFMKTKWYEDNIKLAAIEDQMFLNSCVVFVNFLTKLKACLTANSATFADMKLANVGYAVSKGGNVQWRLLDLDGINFKYLTFPYARKKPELEKQTAYAFGMTVAEYVAPKLGTPLESYFYLGKTGADFDPQKCKSALTRIYRAVEELAEKNNELAPMAEFILQANQILIEENPVKKNRFTVTSP